MIRPAFTWLFLATPKAGPVVTPVVVRTEADTEQLAREHYPDWDLVFAAQIRTGSPFQAAFTCPETKVTWLIQGSEIEDSACARERMLQSGL